MYFSRRASLRVIIKPQKEIIKLTEVEKENAIKQERYLAKRKSVMSDTINYVVLKHEDAKRTRQYRKTRLKQKKEITREKNLNYA